MRKFISAALTAAMVFSLSACGGNSAGNDTAQATEGQTTEAQAEGTEGAEAEESLSLIHISTSLTRWATPPAQRQPLFCIGL